MTVSQVCLVASGGALGALARFGFYLALPSARFPWATLAVNVLGCFAAGLLVGKLGDAADFRNSIYLFGATGFLGAFTTFSAFSVDTLSLLQTPDKLLANIAAQVLLCLAAAFLGSRIALVVF